MRPILRVVVADDDECVRALLCATVAQLGHEVIEVDGGAALVEACLTAAPDLVISDVQMPDMNGITAVAVIRRQAPTPVVLMSGGWDTESLDRAADAGAAWCLVKPVRPLELVAVLKMVARRPEIGEASASVGQ